MTKTRWIAGAALASLIAAAGIAQAAPGRDGPQPPKTRAEVQAKVAEQFRAADANKDGFVTKAEADAARDAMKAKFAERRGERREAHFAKLDTDKNGQLSKAEFTAPRERGDKDGRRGGHHRGGHGKFGHGGGFGGMWFDKADANKDGKVSLAEAQAGALARFDRVDTNKDGTISPEEHKAAREAMRAKWQEHRAAKADKQS